MIIAMFAIIMFVSTLVGGFIALKNRDRLHRILGLTAGVLLGVVAFDLLPEIFHLAEETGTDPTIPMIALVCGFLGFHILEKLFIMHQAHEHEYEHGHSHPRLGQLSAAAIIAHATVDGLSIGLAFQVSNEVGLAVAIAVIAHNFADGLNTVTLMLRHQNTRAKAILMLGLNALAPVAGILSTFFFELSEQALSGYLGFFAGFLLYLGASDILPEAHAKHPSRLTLAMTVLGVTTVFLITRVHLH